jgi:serine/threonine protein kinase
MCPAADVLLAFSSGELPEARAIDIEAHIDECSECRAVLSNIARGGPPPSLGRYRIDTVLGSGGMGIVYRGFDPQLARPVAIKVVRRGGEDATSRQRLIREAQSLARLSHPNVCHVYDVGTHDDDEVWVAMELIDGVQLRQWGEEGHSREELMTALGGAADGILAAHDVGLIHRDIKPENVLVTRDGRAIVTDFGLARHEDVVDVNAPTMASDPQLTATGAIAGTPAYLAPEQLLGDPLDARVDQFAWAVMAWELLTGTRPFPIVFAVRVEAVRAGVQPSPKIPPHINDALARAMAADPADRFPSMRELIEAFRAQPAQARSRGPIVPTRGRAAAIAGLVVLGAGAIAVTQWPRSERASRSESTPAATPSVHLPAASFADPTNVVDEPAPAPRAAAAIEAPGAAVPKAAKPAAATTKVAHVAKAAKPVAETAPPPPATQQLSQQEPQGPVISAPQPAPRGRYCRSCQIASTDAFCRIPTDFEKPGFKNNFDVVDWGTVTKIEDETGTFRDEQLKETVITMRGQRKTYRITAEFLDSVVTTKVGEKLAICPEDENDLYQLSGGPTTLTRAVITLSAEPPILTAAKLGASHIPDIRLAAESGRKQLDRLEPTGRYLVHAKVYGIEGDRYRMDRYILAVPKGMKNEELLVPKKYVWMVVEKPAFEEVGGETILVVRAAAILPELFP